MTPRYGIPAREYLGTINTTTSRHYRSHGIVEFVLASEARQRAEFEAKAEETERARRSRCSAARERGRHDGGWLGTELPRVRRSSPRLPDTVSREIARLTQADVCGAAVPALCGPRSGTVQVRVREALPPSAAPCAEAPDRKRARTPESWSDEIGSAPVSPAGEHILHVLSAARPVLQTGELQALKSAASRDDVSFPQPTIDATPFKWLAMYDHRGAVAFHPKEQFQHMFEQPSLGMLTPTPGMVHPQLRIANRPNPFASVAPHYII